MTHLDKLVAHTVWANGEWITFAAKNFPADDFVLVRLSHILLGERAWFATWTLWAPRYALAA